MALKVRVTKNDSTIGYFECNNTIELIYFLGEIGMNNVRVFKVLPTKRPVYESFTFERIEWVEPWSLYND